MNVIAIMRFPVHGFQCDMFLSPSGSVKLDKCNEAQDAFWCLRQVKVNLLNLSKTLFWWYLRKIRKKCPNFEKWKWTSFTADQLQSAGNLTSCVRQKQLLFFIFHFCLIIDFHLIIKTLATATGKLSFCVGQRAAQENDSFEAVTALTAPA